MNLPTYSATLIDGLRAARRVVVLTGAGVSAESGIPTFRDKLVGLWEKYEPADLATPAAFLRDAALVWGWYEWRRMTVLRAQPNAAHRALTALRDLVPELTLITQNVDDLHERAGSCDVLHLHGRLAQPYCEKCQQPYVFPPGIPDLPPGGERIEPPRCSQCGGKVRPGVVWLVIGDVDDPPIALQPQSVFAAISGAAAVIDVEHREAAAGPILGARAQGRRGGGGRAAMAMHDQRRQLRGCGEIDVARLVVEAVGLPAVVGIEGHRLRRRQDEPR